MDGWVKYECRFLYWLKTPDAGKWARLERKVTTSDRATAMPYPLWKLDNGDQNIPPGLPCTNAVLLVDTHETSYNRLASGEATRIVDPREKRRNIYHLLFLVKGDERQPYVELGSFHSILPVSPNLDIRRLPAEPHRERMWDDQPPIELSVENAIRFIVNDFIEFRTSELKAVTTDLREVLDREVR